MTEREEYETWADTHKPMVALTLKSNLSYFETWQAGRNSPRESPWKGTFFAGFPIEYDYYDGALSIVWESETTAIARFHNPASKPEACDFYGTCFLKVVQDTCELKALIKDPGPRVHRSMRRYLKEVQLRGFYRRLKEGKLIEVWY